MPDKLMSMFDEWSKTQPDPAASTTFQVFQGGVTAGAVSMRQRATTIITTTKMSNTVKNALLSAIGQLSDIPQE